jgi:lipoprotein-anchoring transpeptidase ErfK/SrfK
MAPDAGTARAVRGLLAALVGAVAGIGPAHVAPARAAPQTPPPPVPAPPAPPSPGPGAGPGDAGAAGRAPEAARFRTAREQTLLARAGFSPGLIDNRPGPRTRAALEHYQAARGLAVTGQLDAATLAALAERDALAAGDEWTRPYTITPADEALITGPIPEDWNQRARLELSGYADMGELLAERGWCSPDLVRALNPGVEPAALRAGAVVRLPDVRAPALPRLASLRIDLTNRRLLGLGERGQVLALMPCSIARSAEKRPVGVLRVRVVVTDPDYTFDPAAWPEVDHVSRPLRIAPGPRNPVGLAWIGLDRPGYGIHGTPRPQDIGRTGSHGCFRLTNWDAVRLAHAVRPGTPVEVHE